MSSVMTRLAIGGSLAALGVSGAFAQAVPQAIGVPAEDPGVQHRIPGVAGQRVSEVGNQGGVDGERQRQESQRHQADQHGFTA